MGMLPVFELRLAIPVGVFTFGLNKLQVYILALLGNMLPVIPLLLVFNNFFHKLKHIKIAGPFFRWWFRSVEKRSKIVRELEFWGLVCFVAIPLPITGAWTGTVAATLIELPVKRSFFAIMLGVMIAGVIVTGLCIILPEVIKAWSTFI